MKPLVYVAGPYTKPDPVINVQRAIEIAEKIENHGATPFIPHLSMLWHLVRPAAINRWYLRDLEVLDHCDALYRMPGESVGADREVAHAHEMGMQVVTGMGGLDLFMELWKART
jgi:hypothetical protein